MKITLPKSPKSTRSRLLMKNVAASFLLKGWSAVVVLLMVPVTLKCLGEYNNGVWLTISSIMLWIDNLDIGLGNGLRNKMATSLAHGDNLQTKALLSSTFAMLTCIIIPTMLLLLLLIATSDTYQLLNVETARVSDLDQTLSVTVMLVCSTFIFKLIGNFYMGLQLPAVSNLLIALGQTLALIGTWLVFLSGSHSLMHIAIVNTSCPLLVYLLAYPYTFWYKYPHLRPAVSLINLREAKSVISMGIQFFVMQISGVILFMSSNILISKLFNPAMVTPYQITYRYFSTMLVLCTVICMPFWNATTDAYERGDMQWIHQATRKLRLVMIGIFTCIIVMLLLSDVVYSIWIGDAVIIDFRMSCVMAAYIFTLIYSMRYSYLINGIGKLRLQLIITATAAVLFIPLAYIVVKLTDDIICFMAVMCIVNLPGMIVNRLQFKKLVNGTAKGIWNQ